jgi:flavin reductase (DIM6/NTAB) family NADH-FMN oxidoreductase RutF
MSKISRTIKKILFADSLVPQEFTLGLEEPQKEIAVLFCGAGISRDVTFHHSMVCASPLILCVGFNKGERPREPEMARLSLEFRERGDRKQMLGKIGLRFTSAISTDDSDFLLFEPKSSRNYCLPKARLWSHYLLHAWQLGNDNRNGIKMTFLERRAGMVVFICPRPIVLVSVGSTSNGNVFPMNIFGNLGNGYLGFGLRSERVVGGLIERSGRAALSSIPLSQGYLAYRLAGNHTKESIDWEQLPFSTKPSSRFQIPCPDFAQRVREVEIASVHSIGSHRFFLARTVHDATTSNEPGFCSIHGFYQSWRLQYAQKPEHELNSSLAEDAFNKTRTL